MRLENKVALITGAGSGIGRESARLFAQEGARIVVVDVNDPAGETVALELRSAGREAGFFLPRVSKTAGPHGVSPAPPASLRRPPRPLNNARHPPPQHTQP